MITSPIDYVALGGVLLMPGVGGVAGVGLRLPHLVVHYRPIDVILFCKTLLAAEFAQKRIYMSLNDSCSTGAVSATSL